ncbi:MAG: hypothetical protein ACFBZ9_07860 [Sphingomonadales bacterium]
MFRIIWFFGCLFVAVLLAVIGKSLMPILASQLSPDGISHGIYDLLSRSNVVGTSVVLALFLFFFTFLALGGQVLVDGLTMRKFFQQLFEKSQISGGQNAVSFLEFMKVASDSGDFAGPAEDYATHRSSGEQEPLRAKLPANHFFDDQTQIRSRLNLWVFDNMLVIASVLGLGLFFLAMVIGVDDVVFQSQMSLRTPVSGLLTPLQEGLFALFILLITGLACRIMTGAMVDVRRTQVTRFNGLLDGMFLSEDSGLESLQKPLKALSEAQALIADDKSDQLGKAMESALKAFKTSLTGEFTKQIKSTSKLLEETEKQVTKSAVAVEAANDTLAKYARGQSNAIDKAIASSLNQYFKDEDKSRAGLQDAISNAVKTATQALETGSAESAAALKQALDQINQNYGGGLSGTAKALEDTQGEIARLVAAVERLAALPPRQAGGAREEYLRLVEDGNLQTVPATDASPLKDIEPGISDEQVTQLTETLKRERDAGNEIPKKASKEASKRLENALKSLRNQSEPKDLPDL